MWATYEAYFSGDVCKYLTRSEPDLSPDASPEDWQSLVHTENLIIHEWRGEYRPPNFIRFVIQVKQQ